MKKQINEIKRMQQLAGIITESKNQSSLEAVAGTLDMVLDDILPEYIERGETLTGTIPSEEYADEDSWGDSEDFKKALAYIKNNGGEIKVNTKNPTLMFTNMDITYKLKNNGDIKYTVVVPSKKMDEAQLNENISDEAIERMEGLANTHHLSTLKFSLENLVPEWIQDGGFDEDDVIDYLTHLVRNSY
jgi:hypothetical protein